MKYAVIMFRLKWHICLIIKSVCLCVEYLAVKQLANVEVGRNHCIDHKYCRRSNELFCSNGKDVPVYLTDNSMSANKYQISQG